MLSSLLCTALPPHDDARDQHDESEPKQRQDELGHVCEAVKSMQSPVGKRWSGETAYEYRGQHEAGASRG